MEKQDYARIYQEGDGPQMLVRLSYQSNQHCVVYSMFHPGSYIEMSRPMYFENRQAAFNYFNNPVKNWEPKLYLSLQKGMKQAVARIEAESKQKASEN